MFSVGIILLELFSMFTSSTDRIHTIYKARAGHVILTAVDDVSFSPEDLAVEIMMIGGGVKIPTYLERDWEVFVKQREEFFMEEKEIKSNVGEKNGNKNFSHSNYPTLGNYPTLSTNLSYPYQAQSPQTSATTLFFEHTNLLSPNGILSPISYGGNNVAPNNTTFFDQNNDEKENNNNNNNEREDKRAYLLKKELWFRQAQEVEEIKEIITNLLSNTPTTRFSCEEVLRSQWWRKQQLRAFNHGHFR
jgi:hypothetical protein